MTLRRIALTMIVVAAFFIALGIVLDFLVDWLWFSTLGYLSVFLISFVAKASLFLVVFATSALILWLNGTLAHRLVKRSGTFPLAFGPWGSAGHQSLAVLLKHPFSQIPWRFLIAGISLILGALIALGEIGSWDTVLRFLWQAPYGQADPLYGKDIGFYLFSLPAYVAIKNWMLLILVLSALFAGGVYFAHGSAGAGLPTPSWVIAHGSALLGLFFAIKAWSYWLDRYLLLYHDNGGVLGAAYTDVHVELPMLSVLIVLASAAAAASWANIWVRSYKLPALGAALVFGSSFLLLLIVPGLFQRLYVKPNELQLETPYLQSNISLTQEAYALRKITAKPFPAEQGLTLKSLEENRATIDNIRLWDWKPLIDTYAQLQEIRTYYSFLDLDVVTSIATSLAVPISR